jgi:hypothetical protein
VLSKLFLFKKSIFFGAYALLKSLVLKGCFFGAAALFFKKKGAKKLI